MINATFPQMLTILVIATSFTLSGCSKKEDHHGEEKAAQKAEAKPAAAEKAPAAAPAAAAPAAPAAAPAAKVVEAAPAAAAADEAHGPVAPDGAKVMFLEPADGAVVHGAAKDGKIQFHVKMGVEGMTVRPAGEIVAGTGHHHIIINHKPTAHGEPVPSDDTHIHYGKGQLETDLHLAPGKYALSLQFANGVHLSYGPELSSTIHITVKAHD